MAAIGIREIYSAKKKYTYHQYGEDIIKICNVAKCGNPVGFHYWINGLCRKFMNCLTREEALIKIRQRYNIF